MVALKGACAVLLAVVLLVSVAPGPAPVSARAGSRDPAEPRVKVQLSSSDLGKRDVERPQTTAVTEADAERAQRGSEFDAAYKLPKSPRKKDVDDCLSGSDADSDGGRTMNRRVWCQKARLRADLWSLDSSGDPVEHEGTNYISYVTIAYATNSAREVRVFFRSVEGSAEYDDWGPYDNAFVAPKMRLLVAPTCSFETECAPDPSQYIRTYDVWNADDRWLSWDVADTADETSGPDRVTNTHHKLRFMVSGNHDGYEYESKPFETAAHPVRCDSADYFTWGGRDYPDACVFPDVVTRLQYAIGGKADAVARHIECAQDPSCNGATYPSQEDAKNIPGGFAGPWWDSPGLHRGDWGDGAANRSEVRKACKRRAPYQKTGLPPSKQPGKDEDCDEYPFASTIEGAASEDWDFSVRAVPAPDNQSAGGTLSYFYFSQRILREKDEFFVEITDGVGGDPNIPGTEDAPPVVDAGPDVSGDEGSAIELDGSASDRELGVPDVKWSYEATSGVDDGATCDFDGVRRPSATIKCTDDGTYTVRLTADDGVNPPVSDSATVRVKNVAPVVKVDDPQPWQVYRAGDDVDLTAPFVDPGSNDTHTCRVDWDDESEPETYPAEKRSCGKRKTFEHAGMYTIEVEVTDDDGGSSTADVMVVVYDPEAGLMTSTGKARTPEGALRTDPDTSAPGWFEALGKYLFVNDTKPFGTVAYKVPGTDLKLFSTDLEWLVITPDAKVAIKGVGTGKNDEKFGYVLYAHSDRFRVVVWPLADGPIPPESTLYDNSRGASYDLDEAEPPEVVAGLTVIDSGYIPGLPGL
jgi:Deoxyribonuclease NucA/NucB/PKD domain